MANVMLKDLGEMTQRYQNSYISRIDEKTGKRVPLLVSQFHREDGSACVRDAMDNDYQEKEICLDRPKLGVFNVGKYVVNISSVPRRQWKRGFVYKEAAVINRFEKERDMAGHRVHSRDAVLKAIYEAEYPSVDEALKEVVGLKSLARAFSPKFYFGIQYNGSQVYIFYKKWIVGYMNDDSTVAMLKSHHLYEELSQFLKVEKV